MTWELRGTRQRFFILYSLFFLYEKNCPGLGW